MKITPLESKIKAVDCGRMAHMDMNNGDTLTVTYVDPHGGENTIMLTTQHLVFLATHHETQASIVVRPSKVSVVEPEVPAHKRTEGN